MADKTHAQEHAALCPDLHEPSREPNEQRDGEGINEHATSDDDARQVVLIMNDDGNENGEKGQRNSVQTNTESDSNTGADKVAASTVVVSDIGDGRQHCSGPNLSEGEAVTEPLETNEENNEDDAVTESPASQEFEMDSREKRSPKQNQVENDRNEPGKEGGGEEPKVAVNYPTALQKTLQLMADTDINTTEHTPSNSVDLRYKGPTVQSPNRMPGLSSLPAMFTESQPALFELGQNQTATTAASAQENRRGSLRHRPNSGGPSPSRASPTGNESDTSGIIIEETEEEEEVGGNEERSNSGSSTGNEEESRLEARLSNLERMVANLMELLVQKEHTGTAPCAAETQATVAEHSGEDAVTATPSRDQSDQNSDYETPLSPVFSAAKDLAQSNVLPLDSPSPVARRKVKSFVSHGKINGDAPSPPILEPLKEGDNIDSAHPDPEIEMSGSKTNVSSSRLELQPTPDLEYRSYSQQQVDALRRRREAGARRSYSFDVAEQLERELTLEAMKSVSKEAPEKSSCRKPKLPPVPPSPNADGEGADKAAGVGEVEDPAKSLAPRVESRRMLSPQPSKDFRVRQLSSTDFDEASASKSERGKRPPLKKEANATRLCRPPSRTNSSSSLASKIRSSSVASSTDEKVGVSPEKTKRSSKLKMTPSKQKAPENTPGKGKLALSSSLSNSFGSPEIPGRQSMLAYLKKEMMIDSSRQEGSAADDVDANMQEFLRVPAKLERLLFFGFWICTDAFLYVLTFLPVKFIWSCICLIASIIRPKHGFGPCSFHRRHLYQILQMFVVVAVYRNVLMPISIGVLYHWIRGQAMLKLYVLIAIVEVFDRLLCSIGQDALDSLYWNCTRHPYHPRMIVSTTVVLIYATFHSLLLFLHVATLNVAMNSSDQALLTLIISGNFAEIKSTVFKKYNKQNLFKITTSDICERFKLALFLLLILILNCFQGGMNQDKIFDYMRVCGIVLVAEFFADWIKHSFITKFNFIKSDVYPDYALILAGDLTGIGHEGINLNHTHAVVKRLGFSQIPIVCVMLRFLNEAMRYAIVFSHGDTEYFFNTFAFLYSEGRWATLAIIMFGVFLLTIIAKVFLGFALLGVARKMLLEGPAHHPSEGKTSVIAKDKSGNHVKTR